MLRTISLILALSVVATLPGLGHPQASPKPTEPGAGANRPPDPSFFPLKDVKPGMKGIGRTIFQGTKIEEFGVEVLGVLPSYPGPHQSLIIVRLSGANAERTGVFAGMSGSPVFIDGKVVGAVAIAFPFAKEPIGGVTPIEDMISVFEGGAVEPRAARGPCSFGDLVAGNPFPATGSGFSETARQLGGEALGVPSLAPFYGQTMTPIAAPVTASGIPPEVLAAFAPQFEALGFKLTAAPGGGAPIRALKPFDDATLRPGQTVAVHLAQGDFSFAASGTVTWRDGKDVIAFGHPFLSIGNAAFPMSEGTVVGVVPNVNNSFKLVVPDAPVGVIDQDRSTAIRGRLGETARMIPVVLNVETALGTRRSYRFDVVQDVFLTPILVNLGVVGAITATERSLGDLTLRMDAQIQVEGQPDIQLANSFSSRFNPAGTLGLALAQPLSVLLGSGFDNVNLKGLTVNVSAADNRNVGTLERLWVGKTRVARGEKLELAAFARTANGQSFVERVFLEIPADARPGLAVVTMSDGNTLAVGERRSIASVPNPKDIGQLVRLMNGLRKNNRMYVKLYRSESGAVVNNEELPSLPPSMLNVLGSSRTSGGFQSLGVATLVEKELPPAKFLITGQQSVTVEIVK